MVRKNYSLSTMKTKKIVTSIRLHNKLINRMEKVLYLVLKKSFAITVVGTMILSAFVEQIKLTKNSYACKSFLFFCCRLSTAFLLSPYLFFKRNGLNITVLSCASNDIAAIKALLSTMSFAGDVTYWLEDFYTLSEKNNKR